MGTDANFAVVAGTTVTNTGPTLIGGDLGVSPGSAVTGFPPGLVNGVQHVTDAVAAQAQLDLTTAYNDAAGRTPVIATGPDLSGMTLVSGVYSADALSLTGTVTLDAQGDPTAAFVFQAASTLITGSSSVVTLINGANPCNVFWQVVSSATLGTNSTFVGTIMALTSISAQTGAQVTGRLLARNGAVTLDSNVITGGANCAVAPPAATTTTAAATTTIAASTTVAAAPTSVALPRTGTSSTVTEWAALFAIVAGGSTLLLLRRKPRRPAS
jgi:LPXTG-motif cell wall-anchored protein